MTSNDDALERFLRQHLSEVVAGGTVDTAALAELAEQRLGNGRNLKDIETLAIAIAQELGVAVLFKDSEA